MTTETVFNANQFRFFINKNDDYQKSFTGKPYNVSLAPTKNYVCPNANEFELKALADFIYDYLQMNVARQVMAEDTEALRNLGDS
jgi:hypothetical protein